MLLQLSEDLQNPTVPLHGQTAQQMAGYIGVLCLQQSLNQSVPHVLRGAVIQLRRIINLRLQGGPGQLRGANPMTVQQIQKIPVPRVLLQPFHMLNQTVQLLLNLFRRPGHHLPALLLRLAAPAQALIAQLPAAFWTVVHLAHVSHPLSVYKIWRPFHSRPEQKSRPDS